MLSGGNNQFAKGQRQICIRHIEGGRHKNWLPSRSSEFVVEGEISLVSRTQEKSRSRTKGLFLP